MLECAISKDAISQEVSLVLVFNGKILCFCCILQKGITEESQIATFLVGTSLRIQKKLLLPPTPIELWILFYSWMWILNTWIDIFSALCRWCVRRAVEEESSLSSPCIPKMRNERNYVMTWKVFIIIKMGMPSEFHYYRSDMKMQTEWRHFFVCTSLAACFGADNNSLWTFHFFSRPFSLKTALHALHKFKEPWK